MRAGVEDGRHFKRLSADWTFCGTFDFVDEKSRAFERRAFCAGLETKLDRFGYDAGERADFEFHGFDFAAGLHVGLADFDDFLGKRDFMHKHRVLCQSTREVPMWD